MQHYPDAIQKAIEYFSKLPGIGTKTAERLVFFLLRKSPKEQEEFVQALQDIRNGIHVCGMCGYVTDNNQKLCMFCADDNRKKSMLCVVPDIQTVQSIEKSNAFKGRYHVLGGVINPIEGISADMLTVDALKKRLQNDTRIAEIILATGTDIEGEQTALYITKAIRLPHIRFMRLARGLPRGTNLEYTDELTLADAITNRTAM